MPPSLVRRLVRRTALTLAGAFCLAGMLAGGTAAHAQGVYAPISPLLTTGTAPQGVAAADFARSGYQSLVVTSKSSNNMKVYLGTGAGTFNTGFTYATCAGPTAVIARDFTQDGYPDILVVCPTAATNNVEFFQNAGTTAPGTFSSAASFTVANPVALVAGDFLGNGYQDVAIASGTGGITVLIDVGGNSVVTKTVSVTGGLTGIVTGDFNHDGHLDLAVSDSTNNNVHVLTGDGTGTFAAASTPAAGSKPSAIATTDFNNDGNLDLAVTDAGSNTVSILLGSAAGTFTLQASAPAAGTDRIALVVTDVNSDGHPDIVAVDGKLGNSDNVGALSILLGNGNGTFAAAQTITTSAAPGLQIVAADFNRDGKPDLAITLQSGVNEAGVLLNNTLPTPYPGGRSFGPQSAIAAGNGNMADGIATGDFNKDGKLDIAVSYLADNSVRVMLNNGSGFNTATVYPVGKQPYWISAGDINGDGYPDLVTANTTDGSISVLLSNGKAGNGTFATAVTYTVGKLPYQVAVGDIDGDGYGDVAVANYGANTVSILWGSKAGTLTTGPVLSTGTNPYGVAIGDFAHNNHSSIAVTCYHTAQLDVFPNNGNRTFASPYIYSTDSYPTSLVTGDFNRDGKLDIVVGNSIANDLSFFAGTGTGTFAAGVVSPSLNFPDSIAAGDTNGDGILDIVAVAPNFNKVQVSLGAGNGTFGTIQQRAQGEFTATKQPWAVALGDFNNDGQLDIVTANTYNQVNLTIPAYQVRYLTQYPAIAGGNPSVDLLLNDSAASITLSVSPASPVPYSNTSVTVTAAVQPALSGSTPTGSVIFEDASGSPWGTGPYTLSSGGSASYSAGHLASGSYLFTSLYSGDINYQPATLSGSSSVLTVAGTPTSLTVSPASVVYASTFTASTTVTGTVGLGVPSGTVTVSAAPAVYNAGTGTFTSVGTFVTVGTINLVTAGNNTTGTATITALAPNLNVGTYAIYAVYNPTNGNYAQGGSSYQLLTVTPEPTFTALNCSISFGATPCTATVTASGGGYAPNGDTVTYTATGVGPQIFPIIANGKTGTYSYYTVVGTFTITATFPAQGNYATSSASVNGFCFIFFCADGVRSPGPITLNSLTGLDSGANTRALTGTQYQQARYLRFPLY